MFLALIASVQAACTLIGYEPVPSPDPGGGADTGHELPWLDGGNSSDRLDAGLDVGSDAASDDASVGDLDADLPDPDPLDADLPDPDPLDADLPPQDAGEADAGDDDEDAGPPDAGSGTPDAGSAMPDAGTPTCDVPLFGMCWYMSAANQSCTQTCASHGGVDTNFTKYVGTALQGGSLANCKNVLGKLGAPTSVLTAIRTDFYGFGCHVWNGTSYWLSPRPNASESVAAASARIACGCKK